MDELVKKIIDGTIDPNSAGRRFFEGQFTPAQKAQFLRAYLDLEQYESLAIAIHAGFIKKEYSQASYVNANTETTDLGAQYFHLMMELAQEAQLDYKLFVPLFVAVFSAPTDSFLGAWTSSVEAFLLKEAYRDYDAVLALLTRYDPFYALYGVLMTADRKRTEIELIQRLLYSSGKEVNFSAIRRLLLTQKIDVSYLFGPGYPKKDFKVREAIVRLALLYKNDPRAAAFLQRVRDSEPSAKLRKLAEKKEPQLLDRDDMCVAERLCAVMIRGETIGCDAFLQRLQDPEFSGVAGEVFFSVYMQSRGLVAIVVTNDGKVYDLDNRPYVFQEGALVGVTHPVEIPPELDYIKRLNLPAQPFLQIERPVYALDGYESATNIIRRLEGTLLTAQTFKNNLKAYGFRLLSGQRDDEPPCRAAFTLGEFSCVLTFTPTDFTQKDAPIRLGEARLYRADDFIRVGAKLYAEGVPSRPLTALTPRAFSEFVYALFCVADRAQ